MEKRNRLWRKRHQWRLFKAKMVLFANYPYPHFIDDEGNCIQHLHWFDLAKQRWNYHYKSMRTPCSCWLCRGEKYNRREYKKDSLQIMKESMEYKKKSRGATHFSVRGLLSVSAKQFILKFQHSLFVPTNHENHPP